MSLRWLHKCLSRLAARRRGDRLPKRAPVRWYRPRLEALEDRTMLSASPVAASDLIKAFVDQFPEIQQVSSIFANAQAIPLIGNALDSLPALKTFTDTIQTIESDIQQVVNARGLFFNGTEYFVPIEIPLLHESFGFNLGLDSFLKLKVQGNVQTDLVIDYLLGFTVNGPSISIDLNTRLDQNSNLFTALSGPNVPSFPAAPLAVRFLATLPDFQGGPNDYFGSFSLDGFLFTKIRDQGTFFKGTFGLGLDSGNNLQASFAGDLKLNLGLDIHFVDPSVSAPINPEFKTDFNLDWSFAAGDSVGAGSAGDISGGSISGGLSNFRIEVGPLFDSFLSGIVSKIQVLTEPMAPLIDFMNSKVPIIDKFGFDRTFVSLLQNPPSGLDNILTLLQIINNYHPGAGGEVTLPGGFTFGNVRQVNLQGLADFGIDPSGVDSVVSAVQNLVSQESAASGDGDAQFAADFPILSNPASVIPAILLGKDAQLFTLKVNTNVDIKVPFGFGIPGIFDAGLQGSLNLDANLSAGYDSNGLKKFFQDKGSNIGDLLDGIYIDKTTNLSLGSSLTLFADLLFSHVEGGIFANLNVAINTPSGEDRVHLNELNTSDIACLFTVSGGVDARADFSVGIDPPIGPSITLYSDTLADEQLAHFQTMCPGEPTSPTPPGDEILRILLRNEDQTVHVFPYLQDLSDHTKGVESFTDKIYGLEVDDGSQVTQYPMARYTQNMGAMGFHDGWHFYNQNGNTSPGDAGIKGIMTTATVGNVVIGFPTSGNHRVIVDTVAPDGTSAIPDLGIDFNQLPVLLVGGLGNDDLEYNGTGQAVLMGGPGGTHLLQTARLVNGFWIGSSNSIIVGGPGNSTLVGGNVEIGGTWAQAGSPAVFPNDWPAALTSEIQLENGTESGNTADGNHILIGRGGNEKLYGGKGKSKLIAGGGTEFLHGGPGDNEFVVQGFGSGFVTGGSGTNTLIVNGADQMLFVPPANPDKITVSYKTGIFTGVSVDSQGSNNNLHLVLSDNIQNLSLFPGESANSIEVDDLSQSKSKLQNITIGVLSSIPNATLRPRAAQTVTIKGSSQFNLFDVNNFKEMDAHGKLGSKATDVKRTVEDQLGGKVLGFQDIFLDGLGQGDQLILDGSGGQNGFSDTLDPSMTYGTALRSTNNSDSLIVDSSATGNFTVSNSQVTFALPGSGSGPTINYSSSNVKNITVLAGLTGTNQVTVNLPPLGGGFDMNIDVSGIPNNGTTLAVDDAVADDNTEGDYTFANDVVLGSSMHLHRFVRQSALEGDATIMYNDVGSFILNPSSVPADSLNKIFVDSVVYPLTVNAQGGENDAVVAAASKNLDDVRAPVTINGGKNAHTTVTINDQKNAYKVSGENYYEVGGNFVLRQNRDPNAPPPSGKSFVNQNQNLSGSSSNSSVAKMFSPLLGANSPAALALFTGIMSGNVSQLVSLVANPSNLSRFFISTITTGNAASTHQAIPWFSVGTAIAHPAEVFNAYSADYGPGGKYVATIYDNNVQSLALNAGGQSNYFSVNSPQVPFATIHDELSQPHADTIDINGLQGQLELQAGNKNDTIDIAPHAGELLQLNTPSAAAILASIPAVNPAVNSSIPILDNDTQAPLQGTFDNAPPGTVFQINGIKYAINYQGGSDGPQPDVILTHVNTPPSNIHTDIALSPLHEGDTVSGNLFFTDPDVLDTHTVTMHWSDNTPDDVIQLDPGVTVTPISHTFAEEGSFVVTATVDDHHPADPTLGIGPGSVTATVNTLTVLDAPLALSNVGPLTEGKNNNVVVATLADSSGNGGSTDDFTVAIDWGDGTTTSGTLNPTGLGSYQVIGSHTYTADEGTTYLPVVTIHDVGGQQVSTLSWQNVANAYIARQGAVAVRGTDGKFYVLGGFINPSGGTIALPHFTRYDPASNTWERLADLPAALRHPGITAAAGADGKIYVFGGVASSASSSKAYAYDPTAKAWQPLADMPQATAYAAAVGGPGGLIYVLGGEAFSPGLFRPVRMLNTVQVYDPSNNSWSMGASMPSGRSDFAAVLNSDGSIYALGGYGSSLQGRQPLATVDIFNTTLNSWTAGPSMPQGRVDFAAIAPAPNLICVVGGDAPSIQNGVATYTVATLPTKTQTWVTEAANLNRRQFAAAGGDGRLYVFSGIMDINGRAAIPNSVLELQVPTVTLADAPLVEGGGLRIQHRDATETVPFTFPLDSFQDAGNDGTTDDYSGTIQWTPTDSTPAQFRLNSNGSVLILGSFTYPLAGTYPITISVYDHGASLTLHKTMMVLSLLGDATLAGTVQSVTEGINSDTDPVLATFTYPNPNVTETQFTASIDWGDGQNQPDIGTGTIHKISQDGGQSVFQVTGRHIYAEAGLYTPITTIAAVAPLPGSPITSQLTSIQVADVPLTDTSPPTTIPATAGLDTGPQVVATFTDPNFYANSGDYAALINWGDGTESNPDITLGTVQFHSFSESDGHDFHVVGSHAYLNPGTYAVSVTVLDSSNPNLFSGDTTFQVGTGSVNVTFQTDSQHSFDVAGQSYSWSGSEPFANGSPTGKATVQDFQLTLNPNTVDPGLWSDMATNRQFVHVTVHVLDAAGNEYLTYALDNVMVSSFQTTESDGATPVDQVTLTFTHVAEDYKNHNPGGTSTDNTAQFDMVNGGGGGSLSPPAPASLPRVGITFDTGTGSTPLPELAAQSYSWAGSQPFANGNPTGKASVQDFQLLLDPSVEPGLWGAMVSNRQLVHATIHVRDAAGREYLTYALDNVRFSSFQISENGGAAPLDGVTLAFTHLTEDYRVFNADGSVTDNQAQFDVNGSGGGSLSPPALTAPPRVGITFETATGMVLGNELAVQSYSWGGSEPFVNGQPIARASVQDFQVTLDPSSVEPGLWGALLSNSSLLHATIHVRDAAFNEYLTYSFDNAMFSSFQISEGGGTAPMDQVTLAFQKMTEHYKAPSSPTFDNQAAVDTSPNGKQGGGSLAPPNLGSPPQVGITFDTFRGAGTELKVQSFSWGGSEPFANGQPIGKASVQDLQVTLDPSSVEPGLWGTMLSNLTLLHATLHVGQYLTYTLGNAKFSSFQITESGGAAPVDAVTLAFQNVAEDYKVLNPNDNSVVFENQAQLDVVNGGGGGSLSPPALALPPRVGITFETARGQVVGNELAVQSYSWGGSEPFVNGQPTGKASVQDLEVTLKPSSVEPGLWGAMLSNTQLLQATLHVRDATDREYLTYTLDNAMFSTFQIVESGGAAPVDALTLAFQDITEDYQVGATEAGTITNQAHFDVTNGGTSDPLSPPLISPPTVGISFVTDTGAQTAELAVQSYSWGGSAPFLNGMPTGKASLQEFQLTLAPSSVDPELWGAMVSNTEFTHATVHVRDAAGNEYLSYTLDNVHFSSFQTEESGGTAPVDQITLSFTNITQGPSAAQTTTTLTSVAYPTGIVSAYQADGNANDAIGTNNGTIQGNVTFEPGQYGQAYHFDGATGEGVAIPASPSLDVGAGSGVTLTAWINPDSVSAAEEPIIEWTHGLHLWINVNYGGAVGPGDLYANLGDQSIAHIIYSAPGTIQAHQWQFVALTYCKTCGVATLYLNGQEIAQQNLGSFTLNTTSDVNLGHRLPGSFGGIGQFTGGMDEVGIYNRPLTAAEVNSLFTSTGNPSLVGQPVVVTATVNAAKGTPTGNVAFSVDGGAAQTVPVTNGEAQITLNNLGQGSRSITANYTPADSSFQASQASFTQNVASPAPTTTTLTSVAYPSGIISAYQADGNANDAIGTNNGTIQGNVTFEPGQYGKAFHFDGATGEGVNVPASSSLNLGAGNGVTLTAWINPDAVSSEEPIIEWTHGLHLWSTTNYQGATGPGDLYANLGDESTAHIIYSAANAIQAGKWQFVALTYDKASGIATLYLNNQVVAQQNLGSFTLNTTSDVNIGHRLPGSFGGVGQFAGGIDEVGIYNRALTAAEIGSLFTSTGSPSQPGQPVVVTATVSAIQGTPTGSVAFSVDSGTAQTVALANGEAQITLTNLSAAGHTITAVYTPADATFAASQASFTQTVANPSPTWHTIASMSTQRQTCAAATGKDGRIYVFGGQDANFNALASAEVYDPATNTWSAIAPMPTARTLVGAATGPDGRIYVIGGITTQYLSTVEIYDPVTNTWSTGPSTPAPAGATTALSGTDGLIYAFCGARLFVFDPATQAWSTRTFGGNNSGGYYAVAEGADGRFYLLGGSDANGFAVATVQIYNPKTDSWSSGPNMLTARNFGPAAATGSDGRIYAIGGGKNGGGLASVEVYDPSTQSWSTAAAMPQPRQFAATTVGADGRIYVLGGNSVDPNTAISRILSSALVLS